MNRLSNLSEELAIITSTINIGNSTGNQVSVAFSGPETAPAKPCGAMHVCMHYRYEICSYIGVCHVVVWVQPPFARFSTHSCELHPPSSRVEVHLNLVGQVLNFFEWGPLPSCLEDKDLSAHTILTSTAIDFPLHEC